GVVMQAPAQLPQFPFFLAEPSKVGRQQVVKRLLEKYDLKRAGKLTREAIQFPAGVFARLDRNGDGLLDGDELAGWLDLPADLQLLIRMDGAEREGVNILADAGKPFPLANRTKRSRIGSALVALPAEQLEVLFVAGGGPGPPRGPGMVNLQDFRLKDD